MKEVLGKAKIPGEGESHDGEKVALVTSVAVFVDPPVYRSRTAREPLCEGAFEIESLLWASSFDTTPFQENRHPARFAPEACNALLETSEVRLDVKRLLFAAFLDKSYPLSTRASGRIRARNQLVSLKDRPRQEIVRERGGSRPPFLCAFRKKSGSDNAYL